MFDLEERKQKMSMLRCSLGLEEKKESKGWIGVDLDGTLAYYDGWKGIEHIGAPIPRMVERIKKYLEKGQDVRIFTARVAADRTEDRYKAAGYIDAWVKEHIGQTLLITCKKDMQMIRLYDDRARQVVENTGEVVGE